MKSLLIVLIVTAGWLNLDSTSNQTDSDKKTVNIAGIVLKWIPKDREKNHKRFEGLVREAASQKAKIVCTTECFLDGYAARDGDMTAQEFRSHTLKRPGGEYFIKMKRLAHELKIYIIAGVSELDAGKIYNSAIVFGPDGGVVGIYRKNVLWGFEKNMYTAGSGYPVLKTRYGKIGIMICFERQKPKVAQALKNNGAQVIFCLSGGGFGSASDQIMMRRSQETGLPMVFVHPAEFLVTGPNGKILARKMFGSKLDDDKEGSQGGIVGTYRLTLNNNK